MLRRRPRAQQELVFARSLHELIPDGHALARVDRARDLGWLRAEVAACYAAGSGRPRIDRDARLACNHRVRRVEPAYKQHTAIDDEADVVPDVAVTTGAPPCCTRTIPPCCAPDAHAHGGAAGTGALPAPPRPGRTCPRRGQDLVRACPCHPTGGCTTGRSRPSSLPPSATSNAWLTPCCSPCSPRSLPPPRSAPPATAARHHPPYA
jgi:hypothetical protein